MKVVLSRRANLDLMMQIDWLAHLSPSAAAEIGEVVRASLKTLADFPLAGRAINDRERQWPIPFGRDGFIAIYRVEPNRVLIGRLLHSRQDR